jgi:hypothetical protein
MEIAMTMPTQTVPRLVAIGAVIAAGALVLIARAPNDASQVVIPDLARGPTQPTVPVRAGAALEQARESPAAVKLQELAVMSETFRNTTFLIAIRDGGFVCNELLAVYGGANDSTTWTATCSEMLAYTVSIASSGTLHIEPILQYLDGVPRVPPAESGRELVLPPQNR